MILLIYTPLPLGPAALGVWVYISAGITITYVLVIRLVLVFLTDSGNFVISLSLSLLRFLNFVLSILKEVITLYHRKFRELNNLLTGISKKLLPCFCYNLKPWYSYQKICSHAFKGNTITTRVHNIMNSWLQATARNFVEFHTYL